MKPEKEGKKRRLEREKDKQRERERDTILNPRPDGISIEVGVN